MPEVFVTALPVVAFGPVDSELDAEVSERIAGRVAQRCAHRLQRAGHVWTRRYRRQLQCRAHEGRRRVDY